MQLPWRESIGQYLAKALAWLRQATAGFRDLAGMNLRMAAYHLEHGNYADALWRYRLVARLQPRNADAWAGLGMCLMAEAALPEAEAALKRALALKPDHARAREALEILHRHAA